MLSTQHLTIYLMNVSCKFWTPLNSTQNSFTSKFTSNFAHRNSLRLSTVINQIYAPPRRYVLPYCLDNETSHSRQYYPSKDEHKFDPYPHHGNRRSRSSGELRTEERIQPIILSEIYKGFYLHTSILSSHMLHFLVSSKIYILHNYENSI